MEFAFNYFDFDKSGFIEESDLKEIFGRAQYLVNEKKFKHAFKKSTIFGVTHHTEQNDEEEQ